MISPDTLYVNIGDTIRHTMTVIDKGGLGVALLVDEQKSLQNTVSDGDIRRMLLNGGQLDGKLDQLELRAPVTGSENMTRRAALDVMQRKSIRVLPLVGEKNRVLAVWNKDDLDDPILLSTPHMGQLERQYVNEAFETNWIAPLGPNVDLFEIELCRKIGIGHGAAVSSGTAAIHLALRLLGVSGGDIVFCSTLTFVASCNPILYERAEPVFIDCEESSWNMCPLALEKAFAQALKRGQLPKAVIIVNLYGQSADMDPLVEICDKYGVPIIEDAAESLGASYKGKASGTFGKLSIFSFNGNKIITTSGGGMLVSDDADLITEARFLATQARDPAPHYQHTELGFNYRMSNILAGVGRGQLDVLEERVRARREVFGRYAKGLSHLPALTWMPEPDWSFSTRWLSVGLISGGETSRDQLLGQMSDNLIEARPVWKPMHLQPLYDGARYVTAHNESVADRLFRDGICLPSGSNMDVSQIDRTIDVISKAFARPN